MDNDQKIYSLKLHEWIDIGPEGYSIIVFRVPGGWIYKFVDQGLISFVPYDPEFIKRIKYGST